MNIRTRLTATILLSIALCSASVNAEAGAHRRHVAQANPGSAQAQLISADRAAAIARRATGGRVLSVNLSRGAQPVYRVKILMDSRRVRTVTVDARTGNLR
jgi:uncharacterized membrane protein YkoI